MININKNIVSKVKVSLNFTKKMFFKSSKKSNNTRNKQLFYNNLIPKTANFCDKNKIFEKKDVVNNSFEDPLLKYLFEKNVKEKKIPAFKFYSSQIEIITQPSDFYLSIIVS